MSEFPNPGPTLMLLRDRSVVIALSSTHLPHPQHLSQQQRVLEKASTFPEGDNSEASQLRQVLLQYQNDLDQSRERAEKLDRELTQ